MYYLCVLYAIVTLRYYLVRCESNLLEVEVGNLVSARDWQSRSGWSCSLGVYARGKLPEAG